MNLMENNISIDLANLGYTCYLNTIIQLLFHIIQFRNAIMNLDIKTEFNNVLFALKNLFNDMIMYHNDKKYIKPNFFINNYDKYIIDIYNQKDASEFLIDLFDKIEKHLLSTNYKNLIKYFFQGKYNISYTFGISCKHKINKIEPFYNVNLNIDKIDNIEDSLENLISVKSINGDNKIF